MKKIFVLFLSFILMNFFAGCSNQNTDSPAHEVITLENAETDESDKNSVSFEEDDTNKTDSKSVVIYFSVPETTNSDNMTEEEDNSVVVIDGEVLGNTQYVAMLIAENIGANIFRIEPKTPYTTSHEELVDLASQEQKENARPELKQNIENLEDYNIIFIGYPIWWSDLPMILYTFFDENDFSGKTIVLFSTHGGSQLSGTVETITALEPDAQIEKSAFTVSRNIVQDCKEDVLNWLKELKYIE